MQRGFSCESRSKIFNIGTLSSFPWSSCDGGDDHIWGGADNNWLFGGFGDDQLRARLPEDTPSLTKQSVLHFGPRPTSVGRRLMRRDSTVKLSFLCVCETKCPFVLHDAVPDLLD
jgi:hypothetical protein